MKHQTGLSCRTATEALSLNYVLYYTKIIRLRNKFVVPLHLLASQVQLVVLVSAFVMVSSLDTIVFRYSTLGAPDPVICKSGSTCPHAHGVGATFVRQFHSKKHYKTTIQSECTVS